MVAGFALLTTVIVTLGDWERAGPEHGITQWIVSTGIVFLYSFVVAALAAGFVVGIMVLAFRVWDFILSVVGVRE